ncbi:hypothetical protein BV22DRAFT_1050317, partial [Leucogyrophana mollusca]
APNTLQNLCLDFATLGDRKLVERPAVHTIAPDEFQSIKAAIKPAYATRLRRFVARSHQVPHSTRFPHACFLKHLAIAPRARERCTERGCCLEERGCSWRARSLALGLVWDGAGRCGRAQGGAERVQGGAGQCGQVQEGAVATPRRLLTLGAGAVAASIRPRSRLKKVPRISAHAQINLRPFRGRSALGLGRTPQPPSPARGRREHRVLDAAGPSRTPTPWEKAHSCDPGGVGLCRDALEMLVQSLLDLVVDSAIEAVDVYHDKFLELEHTPHAPDGGRHAPASRALTPSNRGPTHAGPPRL